MRLWTSAAVSPFQGRPECVCVYSPRAMLPRAMPGLYCGCPFGAAEAGTATPERTRLPISVSVQCAAALDDAQD